MLRLTICVLSLDTAVTAISKCWSFLLSFAAKKVIAVAGGAFAHLYDLKCAVISKDVVIIGRKAFYKCCSLVNVTIPESVRLSVRWHSAVVNL